jgi:hypothetical protein
MAFLVSHVAIWHCRSFGTFFNSRDPKRHFWRFAIAENLTFVPKETMSWKPFYST